jgi:hypothetical protein
MTPEIEAAWQKYRYENLLPRAIEEEKLNEHRRRISAYLFGGGAIFALKTVAAMVYIEKAYGVRIHDTWVELVIGLPACLPAALGLMGLLMYKGNSIMEVVKIGDTYVPKNP